MQGVACLIRATGRMGSSVSVAASARLSAGASIAQQRFHAIGSPRQCVTSFESIAWQAYVLIVAAVDSCISVQARIGLTLSASSNARVGATVSSLGNAFLGSSVSSGSFLRLGSVYLDQGARVSDAAVQCLKQAPYLHELPWALVAWRIMLFLHMLCHSDGRHSGGDEHDMVWCAFGEFAMVGGRTNLIVVFILGQDFLGSCLSLAGLARFGRFVPVVGISSRLQIVD